MICESYYNRNKIPVPIVKHVDFGILFFNCKDFPFWKIFTIYKQDALNTLFDYVIFEDQIKKRNSNEIREAVCIETTVMRQQEVPWNQYENFIINFKKNFGLQSFDVMVSQREINLFAWEIFVYCHEKYLIKEFLHLEKWLFASINSKNSFDIRYDNYGKFFQECRRFKDVDLFLNFWDNYCERYTGNNYLRWMAQLISNV